VGSGDASRHRWRRVLWILALLPMLGQAESGDTQPAAEQPYDDQLIDGGTSPLETFFGDNYVTDPSGLPRAARVELVGSRLTHGSSQQNESGLLFGGQLATANYGAFSVDGALRFDGGGFGALWQRGMPFDNGWLANNGVGVINAPGIDLLRNQPRFYLPTWIIAGGGTEWRGPGGLQLLAGAGAPGSLTGIRVLEFQRLSGSTYTAGAQWAPSGSTNVGVQWASASNVTIGGALNPALPTFSSQTLYASGSWRNSDILVQGNVIGGTLSGQGTHQGFWVDASVASNQLVHTFGVFRIDPYIVWANQPISSDMQGAYYRVNYQSQQWSIDGGVDAVASVSGQSADIAFATGNVRYQYSRDLGFGSGVNYRYAGNSAGSVFAYVDHAHRWGIGHVQVDLARDSRLNDEQITYSQTWNVPANARLGTLIGVGRTEDRTTGAVNRVTASAFGGGEIFSNVSLDGNFSWTRGAGSLDATALYANAALTWHFAPGWSAAASYYASNANTWTPFTVNSPIGDLPKVQAAQRDRGAFLSLRYDFAAGSYAVPLGGRPGGGSGRVRGTIYLDANDNGRMDAGESGAPNLTVVLDGRFSVRTDAQGRFEFSVVGPGTHVLKVLEDNLQLPWALKNDGRIEIDVRVRDDTLVDVPAHRAR
jgi:hypothetical protein